MRTIVKEYKVYTISELPENIRQKAIEKLAFINVDHEWWDATYEDAKCIGLEITSFDLDRYRHAKGRLLKSPQDVIDLIIKEHGENGYGHKTAMEYAPKFATLLAIDENQFEDAYQELTGEFEKALLEDYSKILQEEYEYLTSVDSILETIDANEYEFTEDGKIFH